MLLIGYCKICWLLKIFCKKVGPKEDMVPSRLLRCRSIFSSSSRWCLSECRQSAHWLLTVTVPWRFSSCKNFCRTSKSYCITSPYVHVEMWRDNLYRARRLRVCAIDRFSDNACVQMMDALRKRCCGVKLTVNTVSAAAAAAVVPRKTTTTVWDYRLITSTTD